MSFVARMDLMRSRIAFPASLSPGLSAPVLSLHSSGDGWAPSPDRV